VCLRTLEWGRGRLSRRAAPDLCVTRPGGKMHNRSCCPDPAYASLAESHPGRWWVSPSSLHAPRVPLFCGPAAPVPTSRVPHPAQRVTRSSRSHLAAAPEPRRSLPDQQPTESRPCLSIPGIPSALHDTPCPPPNPRVTCAFRNIATNPWLLQQCVAQPTPQRSVGAMFFSAHFPLASSRCCVCSAPLTHSAPPSP
jgi:hypothetical protein